jgi:hypothetical protein
MKTAVQFASHYEGTPAWKVRKTNALTGTAAMVFRYCLSARRDEKNGFPFTAAMEWQKAASLCFPNGLLADLCWRKWERIVRLPRKMAMPITDQALRDASTFQHPIPAPTGDERRLLVSA